MDRLKGKIAVITGAASGIGLATAERMIEEGASVFAVDRTADALDGAAARLGPEYVPFVADVADAAAANDYVAAAIAHFGRVDLGFLNAGVPGKFGLITSTPVEEFDRVMAVNVRGVWLGLSRLLESISDNGVITITSSVGGLWGVKGMAPYATSKHAVVGLMRTAALEGSSRGIRVNTIHPGSTETAMVAEITEGRNVVAPSSVIAGKNRSPLGRIGQPVEIAEMVIWLSSDDASFATGATFVVDGGLFAGPNPDIG